MSPSSRARCASSCGAAEAAAVNAASRPEAGPGPAGATLLELEGIRKTYPGVVALDDVSLRLAAGEVLGLVGENGAGKSTLMKVLGGVVRPDAGRIRLHGRDFPQLSVAEAGAQGIALGHQEITVFDNLDVTGNVLMGRKAMWG